MRPTHRSITAALALTLTLGIAGPSQAKDLPSPPHHTANTPSGSPNTSNSNSRWAYTAIGAGGTGLLIIGASGTIAASRHRKRENRQHPTIAA
jgi:hypothetical protein